MHILMETAKEIKMGQKVKLLKNGKVAPFSKVNKNTVPIGYAIKSSKNGKVPIFLTC